LGGRREFVGREGEFVGREGEIVGREFVLEFNGRMGDF